MAKLDWIKIEKTAKIEIVSSLAAKGFSASVIASNFINASRNAVIGFVHREGISIGANRGNAATRVKRTAAQKPRRRRMTEYPKVDDPIFENPPVPPTEEETPEKIVVDPVPSLAPEEIVKTYNGDPIAERQVSILQLNHRTCRWPVMSSYRDVHPSEMMFCGMESNYSTFCAYHSRRAYGGYSYKESQEKSRDNAG